MKTSVLFQIDKELKDSFQRVYPYTLSRFLRNCMKLALSNRTFFESAYFLDSLKKDN